MPGAEADSGELIQRMRNGDREALGSFFSRQRERIIALTMRHTIPGIYWDPALVAEGGLMSYGIDTKEMYRQAGIYVGRILKGASPDNLPVLQPTKFELAINLKAAKALGLDVPLQLQQLADEIIE